MKWSERKHDCPQCQKKFKPIIEDMDSVSMTVKCDAGHLTHVIMKIEAVDFVNYETEEDKK